MSDILEKYYSILNIQSTASDEDVGNAYKRKAVRLHPDKNRDRVEWATEAMKNLNIAYTSIMSSRFKDANGSAPATKEGKKEARQRPQKRKDFVDSEILVQRFIKVRERAKDSLYQFFQYGLNNLAKRESVYSRGRFNTIVHSLKRAYHAIINLAFLTDDPELLEHFRIFNKMLYNFYRASECLNVIDSYSSQYDVDAYRIYRKGDEALHNSHREIFFDRHNRGNFRGHLAYPELLKAETMFKNMLTRYPHSTWIVETGIKLEYARVLKEYLNLFFTKD